MTYYLNSGGKWRPNRESSLDVRTALPPDIYMLAEDEFSNLFLSAVDRFTLPKKIYGNTAKNTQRIVRTFFDRPNATGVLLVGSKGSGKTLLSKNVCTELLEHNVPTIIVNQPFFGDKFNNFIQSIDQPCVVVFDEFEKVYDPKQQLGLLTLLDGVFPSKKLFLLTCNDMYRVDYHMKNRPGRIFYMFKFVSMEHEFIEEYCQDNLDNKSHIAAICRLAQIFSEFNFDMLGALVEEMNRFDESPDEALKVLNILPENDSGGKFKVTIVKDGETYTGAEDFYENDETYSGSPVLAQNDEQCFTIRKRILTPAGFPDTHLEGVYFSAADFRRYDNVNDEFHFERDGVKLTLTKIKTTSYAFNYQAF